MAKIPYEKRQKIIAQAITEIEFARTYKQGKVKNWKINEDLYYGRKMPAEASRANVDLGQMASFVHSLLAKIDTPLTFKYTKRKSSQLQRVIQLNALKVQDQDLDNWDIKDIAGKKQAVIYGRAIYSYYADSYDGYKSHLDNVDVYDFLIDPAGGGIDVEKAMYIGNYGVVKHRNELEQGIRDGVYFRTETNNLLDGSGNSTEMSQEETNKKNRTQDQNVWVTNKNIGNPDKFVFWNWGTTFEGQRYYLLLSERGATAVEVVPIEEKFESGLWWYWTWAAFPDLTEFWTPSFCDYVREVFMAQAVSINQMLDNAEEINKPQKVVNVGAIENMAELKFRRNGMIKVKKDFDISKAYQTVAPPSINTPILVYNILDGVQQRASGITAGTQGAQENGSGEKVAIYEGNQENSADRFGYLNKSYSFGYKRFSKLYEHGVREHLVKKTAVDVLGPDGVEIVMVSRRDLFRKGETYGVLVESSNAELALSEKEKEAKVAFLQAKDAVPPIPGVKPVQNAQKAYEMEATIVGFTEEEIRQLQDTTDYGDAAIMSEAERDIERILDGESFPPNPGANTAYKQRFVDYMTKQGEMLSMQQFTALSNYVLTLDQVIMKNMTRKANDMLFKQQMDTAMTPLPPVETPTATPNVPGKIIKK